MNAGEVEKHVYRAIRGKNLDGGKMIRYQWVAAALILGLAACGADPDPREGIMSTSSRSYLEAGTQALSMHEFDAALALADSALQEQPRLPDAYFLKGRVYTEMWQFDSADAAYKNVLELNPSYRGLWHNMGNNAARKTDYRTAITYYRREIEERPAAAPWRNLGKIYDELGVPDSARYAFERSLRHDSTHAATYIAMAELLEEEGRVAEALNHARRAFELAPESIEARYRFGALLAISDRREEALEHLEAVAHERPWHYSSVYNAGQALIRLGRTDEGQDYLEKAEELRREEAKIEQAQITVKNVPDDPYAHAQLASLLRRAGRYDDAMHAYKVALHLDPGNLEFMNNLAVLHVLQEDNERAVAVLHRLLQSHPDHVDGWLNLGIIYARTGKQEDARDAWRIALQLDPENQAAHAYLARLDPAS